MTFKELKNDYPVYILYKNEVRFTQGKVISVSQPRFQSPSTAIASGFNSTNPQVVDVTIEEDDGIQQTYTIPETLDVTYASGLVLSTSKEKIQIEVENMKHRAEEIIASVERNRQVIVECNKILYDINPALKERQRTEDRFNNLETNMDKMSKMIEQLIKKLE